MKTLETERLILRRWQLEDLDDFYEYARNPDTGIMQGWQPHLSMEASFNALKHYVEEENNWAIVLKGNDKVIGSIKLIPDENRGNYYAKYISFVLSDVYWGKGYMTEAVKCVIKYAFEVLGINLLTAFHFPHNTRSKRVIEKCGFQYEVTIIQEKKYMTDRYLIQFAILY
jgi:putative acetyltransferase